MDYKQINDSELLYMVSEGSEDAYEIVIEKYKYLILHVINELTKGIELVGIEIFDLYQEGLIGLIKAIKTFDEEKQTSFYTYALKCIKSKVISSIRNQGRKKSIALNTSCSLDKILSTNTKLALYEIIKDEKHNPNNIILESENEKEIIEKLFSVSSATEQKILNYKLKGLSNNEIAKLLDKDKKYVENAIFRIKNKYKDLLTKEN